MSDPRTPPPQAAPGSLPAPLTDQDVLDRVHRLTLGNPDVPIPRKQFATLLGLPLRETGVILQRLAGQGLITFVPWRSFRLTAAGAATTPKPLPTLREIRRSS